MFLFHLENDEDQKPNMKKESDAAEKVEAEDFDMESVEVIGDENESGKFPFIFNLF